MTIQELEMSLRQAKRPEEALDICQDWDVLGIGGQRIVLRSSEEGVWKVPWRERGELDNEIEWRLWQEAPGDLQDLLCPVWDRESLSNLQALCTPVSYNDLDSRGRDLVARLSRWGISDSAVNLGLLGGKLVCYDYSYISPALYQSLFA